MTQRRESSAENPFDVAREAASIIAQKSGISSHDIGLTLGSGWGKAADLLGETVSEIPAEDLPGFSRSGVPGHSGIIRSIELPGQNTPSLSAPELISTKIKAFGRLHTR